MTARISLALVMHNHQPVGNFGWVSEEVFEKSYEPMIAALERHPNIRVALHYTGPLLEWMEANQPEAIDRLRGLVERDQIEILGGGLYEPILVALPQRDRISQLRRMSEEITRLFGTTPRGAWLAERVWEPSLPFDLAEGGYQYTVLDDNHLRGAAVADDDMWGAYTTDDQGRLLTVFGTEKGLRYRIPWRPVEELIEYLREHATEDGERLGMMGDDGEKFGGWPGTYELCWGREQWIERCFDAIEQNASWLSTVTPSAWLDTHLPLGRVYVPTSSYVEMTQWALPPVLASRFSRIMAQATETESPALPFLRGGQWRNFQVRYREINDLHKQMLSVSAAVEAMADGPAKDRALDHLHRGQSNDCYWHGLFGGIYIVHMRMATLAELIAAEDLAAGGAATSGTGDFDLDGRDEVAIGTSGQRVVIDIAEGAGIGSWDLRASRVALASVLRRRPEAYHEKLRDAEQKKAAQATDDQVAINPHEDVHFKDTDLSRYLVYDGHERRSGLVRLTTASGQETGDFVNGEWELVEASESKAVLSRSSGGLTLRKTVSVEGARSEGWLSVAIEVRNQSSESFAGV
ncbi:MAG: alpha-amylase/4-alpha-glucanotransferase domain-containing protein, partial [Candidatus Limnocylindrales bacterium]